MKFVVLNGRINGHNSAWADEVYNILGDDFTFIEFLSKPQVQKGSFVGSHVGVRKKRPYVLQMNESEEVKRKSLALIASADVLRFAGVPHELMQIIGKRIRAGKLTFGSGERPFKKNVLCYLLYPPKIKRYYEEYIRYNAPNYRILCQSAYVPNDVRYIKSYKEKCYKFAYINQIPAIDIDQVLSEKSVDRLELFWCARFLDWKHPEMPVMMAKKMINSGRKNFHINMVGSNAMKRWKHIKDMITSNGLSNYVTLTGGIPNTEVLGLMRKSNVFIFTSDRNEGWGVVLNEAMSSGCACVASHEIGSVPFLLKHGENGLVFKSKSVDSLFENVSLLYDNRQLCKEYGRRAYETITGEWSAQTVAKRLVELSESILQGNEIIYNDGPCSKAYPVDSILL